MDERVESSGGHFDAWEGLTLEERGFLSRSLVTLLDGGQQVLSGDLMLERLAGFGIGSPLLVAFGQWPELFPWVTLEELVAERRRMDRQLVFFSDAGVRRRFKFRFGEPRLHFCSVMVELA